MLKPTASPNSVARQHSSKPAPKKWVAVLAGVVLVLIVLGAIAGGVAGYLLNKSNNHQQPTIFTLSQTITVSGQDICSDDPLAVYASQLATTLGLASNRITVVSCDGAKKSTGVVVSEVDATDHEEQVIPIIEGLAEDTTDFQADLNTAFADNSLTTQVTDCETEFSGISVTPSTSSSPTRSKSESSTISVSKSRSASTSLTASATPSKSLSASASPSQVTQSPTPSVTPTRSVSVTPSSSRTESPTRTPTKSITASNTPTISITSSNTPSKSLTASNTPTISLTSSMTASRSISASVTASVSESPSTSATPTISLSSTASTSQSASSSASPSVTSSLSLSSTSSPSPTISLTPSASASASVTTTSSITPSTSASISITATITETASQSASVTPSATASVSESSSSSSTATISETSSATGSVSESPSSSATGSITESSTSSPSTTASNSGTASVSESSTASVSKSSTASISESSTASISESSTASISESSTASISESSTASISESSTASISESSTASISESSTASISESSTASISESSTASISESSTASISESSTASISESSTASISESSTASISESSTASISESSTASASSSSTASISESSSGSITVSISVTISVSASPSLPAPFAVAWGSGASGRLGNAATGTQSLPVNIDHSGVLSGTFVTDMFSGPSADHSLAIDFSGVPYAWGAGGSGRLGNNASPSSQTTPVNVIANGALSGLSVTKMCAGSTHSVAVASDAKVYVWGSGILGDGVTPSTTPRPTPIAVITTGDSALASATVVDVACSSLATFALTLAHTVIGWGTTTGRVLPASPAVIPQLLNGGALNGSTITAVAAGSMHVLALTSAGKVIGWGRSENFQLGPVAADDYPTPFFIDDSASSALHNQVITAIACGGLHSLALTSSGAVIAWGDNTNSQVGNTTYTGNGNPTFVDTSTALSGKTVISICGGEQFSVALTSDGLVTAWGDNSVGAIGDGDSENRATPVFVRRSSPSALENRLVTGIACGKSHVMAWNR